MKRTINVRSHGEGDAVVRVLDVPALKATHVITGTLLELDEDVRAVVLSMVDQSLKLARNGDAARITGTLPTAPPSNPAGTSGE